MIDAPDLPPPPAATLPTGSPGTAGPLIAAAPASRPPRSRKPLAIGAIVTIAAVGLIGGILTTVLGTPITGAPASTSAAPTTSESPSGATSTAPNAAATSPVSAPSLSREQAESAALAQLTSLASSDGARASKNGQWVAQLASKWVGVEDKRLTTASGSHVFYAADILAEHQRLRMQFTSYDVVLLDSRTYGKRLNRNGEAIWVTMVINQGFSGEDAVLSWCQRNYPGLSGKDLLNSCMPNRLNP